MSSNHGRVHGQGRGSSRNKNQAPGTGGRGSGQAPQVPDRKSKPKGIVSELKACFETPSPYPASPPVCYPPHTDTGTRNQAKDVETLPRKTNLYPNIEPQSQTNLRPPPGFEHQVPAPSYAYNNQSAPYDLAPHGNQQNMKHSPPGYPIEPHHLQGYPHPKQYSQQAPLYAAGPQEGSMLQNWGINWPQIHSYGRQYHPKEQLGYAQQAMPQLVYPLPQSNNPDLLTLQNVLINPPQQHIDKQQLPQLYHQQQLQQQHQTYNTQHRSDSIQGQSEQYHHLQYQREKYDQLHVDSHIGDMIQSDNQHHSETNLGKYSDIPYIDDVEVDSRKLQTSTLTNQSLLKAKSEKGWESFTIVIGRTDAAPQITIHTPTHLTPCVVQFAIQQQTQTFSYFQQNNFQINVKYSDTGCIFQVFVGKNDTHDNIEDNIRSTFLNSVKGLDCIEVREGTPQYYKLLKMGSNLPPYFQTNKAAIYSISTGFMIVGYQNEIQKFKMGLCPESDSKETKYAVDIRKFEEKSPTKALVGAGTTNKNTEYHAEGAANVENIRDKKRMTSSEGSVQSTFDQNQAPDSNAHFASQATASSLPQDQAKTEEQEGDDENFMDCMYKFENEVIAISKWTTDVEQKAESGDLGSTIDTTEKIHAEALEFEGECDKKLRILNEGWERFQQVFKKIQSSRSNGEKFVITTKEYKSSTGIIPEGEVMQLVDKYPNQWSGVIRRNGNRQDAPSSLLRDYDLSEGSNACERMFMMSEKNLQSLKKNIQDQYQRLEYKRNYDIFVVKYSELINIMENADGNVDEGSLDDILREMENAAKVIEHTEFEGDASKMCEDIRTRWKQRKASAGEQHEQERDRPDGMKTNTSNVDPVIEEQDSYIQSLHDTETASEMRGRIFGIKVWGKTRLGFMVNLQKEPTWISPLDDIKKVKFQFALTNEIEGYKSYYFEELKDKGLLLTLEDGSVLCKATYQGKSPDQESIKEHIVDTLKSCIEDCIDVIVIQPDSKEFDILFQEKAMDLLNVEVYQDKDIVYIVGDSEEMLTVHEKRKMEMDKTKDEPHSICISGWDYLDVFLKCDNTSKPLPLFGQFERSKLQYILLKKQLIHKELKDKGITMEVIEDKSNCKVNFITTYADNEQTVIANIKETFENGWKGLDVIEFHDQTEGHQLILDTLGGNPPAEINSGFVVALSLQHKIVMVGKKGKLVKMLEKFGLLKVLRMSSNDIKALKDLQYIKNNNYVDEDCRLSKAEVNANNITVVGGRKDLENFEREIRSNIDNIFVSSLTFQPKACQQLFLDEHGSICQRIADKIIEEVNMKIPTKEKGKLNFACTFYLDNDGDIKLACRNKECFEILQKYIRSNIVFHRENFVGKQYLDQFSKSHELKFISVKEDEIEIVCTKDIFDQFMKKQEKSLSLKSLIEEYLHGLGNEWIKTLQTDNNVGIDLTPNKLVVIGIPEDISNFEKQFKQKIQACRKSVDVTLTDEQFRSNSLQSLDQDIKNMCCWKTQWQQEPVFGNGKCLATWFDLVSLNELTLLEGISMQISDIDVIVMPVNSSLHPLKETLTGLENVIIQGCEQIKKINRTFQIGEVHFRTLQKDSKKQLASIVVQDAQNGRNINEEHLSSKIQEVLQLAAEKNYHTVLIDMECINMDIRKMIKPAAAGVLRHFEEKTDEKIQKAYICVKENGSSMMQYVHVPFKNSHTYSKKVYPPFDDIPYDSSSGADLVVEVKEGSLLDIKVDIIVNSTSSNCDLSQGKVSANILKEGGQEIQTALNAKCEYPLKSGQVVVTGGFNLVKRGIKYILHAVLPRDKKNWKNWKNHIKDFMKPCLQKANQMEVSTIAFPALGVGNLCYPRREVAQAMFEAVEEFRNQMINLKLKKVVFVVYGQDKETCQAFKSEEWLRQSKQFENQMEPSGFKVKTGYPVLRLKKTLQNQPCLFVAAEGDVHQKSHAVDIYFILGKKIGKNVKKPSTPEVVSYFIKPASPASKLWNDQIYIEVDEKRDINHGLKSVWNICQHDRVTEAIIHTSKDIKIPEANQAVIICDDLFEKSNVKSDKLHYLGRAFIVVTDFNQVVNSLASVDWSLRKFEDDEINVKTTIEILGKTPEQADEAAIIVDLWQKDIQENYHKQLKQEYERSDTSSPAKEAVFVKQGAQPNDTNGTTNMQTGNMDKNMNTGNGPQTKSSYDKKKMDYSSKGARPKDTNNAVNMQNVDGVNSASNHDDDDDNVTTGAGDKGKHQSELQQSDDSDEGYIDYNELFGEMSASINEGIIDFKEKTGDLQRWCKEIVEGHFKLKTSSAKGCLDVRGSFDDIERFQDYLDRDFPKEPDMVKGVMKTPKKEAPKFKCSPSTMMIYKMKNLTLKLALGDIFQYEADCLATSCQPSLCNRDRLAQKVSKCAGKTYQDECDRSVKVKKELKASECRIIPAAGLKNCRKVANVYIERYKPKENTQKQLVSFEKALQNCLQSVDKEKCQSLVIPCLGSGSLEYEAMYCAQQYMRVVKWFDEDANHLKEITFIDRGKECLKFFHDELCKEESISNEVVQKSLTVFDDNDSRMDFDGKAIHSPGIVENKPKATAWMHKAHNSKFTLHVSETDISAIKIDAVVCPQDFYFEGYGAVAKCLSALGDTEYRQKASDLKLQNVQSKVRLVTASGGLLCNKVIHAATPRWNKKYRKHAKSFERDMTKMIEQIIEDACKSGCKSLAVPLLGTSDDGSETPLQTCCSSMIESIEEYLKLKKNKPCSIGRFEICCPKVSHCFNDILNESINWEPSSLV